jgi:hypothetical protein
MLTYALEHARLDPHLPHLRLEGSVLRFFR